MNETPEPLGSDPAQSDDTAESSVGRGADDRRREVNPAENPAPRSPAPDEDALREGEDKLSQIKPY